MFVHKNSSKVLICSFVFSSYFLLKGTTGFLAFILSINNSHLTYVTPNKFISSVMLNVYFFSNDLVTVCPVKLPTSLKDLNKIQPKQVIRIKFLMTSLGFNKESYHLGLASLNFDNFFSL